MFVKKEIISGDQQVFLVLLVTALGLRRGALRNLEKEKEILSNLALEAEKEEKSGEVERLRAI